MEDRKFRVEFYKNNNFGYILQEQHGLTTKQGGINQFNRYIEEYFLEKEKIEKVDERDFFIWRIKTDKYLLVLRKDF